MVGETQLIMRALICFDFKAKYFATKKQESFYFFAAKYFAERSSQSERIKNIFRQYKIMTR